ncbi:hypothetical protein POM88_047513 [Heracleum sosnowskyi]|uniref:F-box domain-containing protein n=1 Tax=Heracleum sosnowskyi TaxID=360622 RepID=A0AAD8LZP9_9APIA|nr:hypothetical protein POM88_047513 [Heracleum sosnowskyi]
MIDHLCDSDSLQCNTFNFFEIEGHLFSVIEKICVSKVFNSWKVKNSKAAKMRNPSSLVSTENVLFLPCEVLCMILSWLEVKYLLRCKSVCKVWNAVLVNNIQFIDMHAINNGCRSDHIIRHKRKHRTLRFIDEYHVVHLEYKGRERRKKFRFLSYVSCRGLLVAGLTQALAMPATKYRICNLTTKCILNLPHPNKGVIVMRVFLNSSTNSYHVVSLYNDEENKVKFEMIDLGGQSYDRCLNEDLSWRTLNIPEYDVANRLQKYDCSRCVLEEGILFIPALLRVVSSNPIIVCVDLVQQACTTLNAPESLLFENPKVNFQLWRGKPALSFVSEERLNVWIVEDYKINKWADPILIPLPSLDGYAYLRKQIPQIHQGDEEDFLVYSDYMFTKTIKGEYIKGYRVCKIGLEVLSYAETPPPMRVPATLVSVKDISNEHNRQANFRFIDTRGGETVFSIVLPPSRSPDDMAMVGIAGTCCQIHK